jgi:hypothetical protein
MLDLDAIEARANDTVVTSIFRHNVEFAISFASKRMRPAGEITVHDDGRAAQFWKVPELLAELAAARADIPALVAELRAAREAKERVLDMHSSNSGGWCWECAHPSPCRTVTALAAYRAVVGEA